MEGLEIPEELRVKLMAHLGVSGIFRSIIVTKIFTQKTDDHIEEALSLAKKDPAVGVTPFLEHMRKVSEYFSSFENAGKKLAKFHKLTSPGEKVEMVLQALRAHPTYMKASNCLPRGSLQPREGADRSKHLRDQGNKLYQSKKFPEAIRMYTEAALVAGFDSDAKSVEAALAVGNRSAVYFHQKDWSRCEEDLEAALLYGYPENMQYRLAERRGRAQLEQGLIFEAQESLELAGQLVRKSKLSEEQRKAFRKGLKASLESNEEKNSECCDGKVEQAAELPELLEAHPSLPGLSGQAEVRHNGGRGRHTVATSRIEPGQLIARDDIV